MAELSCTCRPGESVAGTRQEIIEQRLAARFGIEVPEVHALLDLHTDTLDTVLDEYADGSPEADVDRRIAVASGRERSWVVSFFEAWEVESDALNDELPNPWEGLSKSLGSNPRFHEN